MTANFAITNGRIYTGQQTLQDHAVLIENDYILGVVPSSEIPIDFQQFDVKGAHVSPGFVDLQIYGGGGVLFAERPTRKSLEIMTKGLISTGTTSFFLTLATNTEEIFHTAIDVIQEFHPPACLGLHFEGPYLNPLKRGAHPTSCLRKPTKENLKNLMQGAKGYLRMMTIAPELFDHSLIALLVQEGVLLSAGHSNATYEEATLGFDSGVKAVTHLFNAMSNFHHRETGLPGATYLHEGVCASIIADGIHVSFEALKVSKQLLGERLFLITDAVEASTSGVYQHVRNGDHFTLPDGTLSGSALTQLLSIKNCVQQADIALDEAIRMATLYPADLIGNHSIGRIASGCQANLAIFDNNFELKHVIYQGELQ